MWFTMQELGLDATLGRMAIKLPVGEMSELSPVFPLIRNPRSMHVVLADQAEVGED